MTREGAVVILRELGRCNDTEAAHADADKVLCELLTSLGYTDVVAEYEKIEKRFA